MTSKQRKELLKAQQGELDAAKNYEHLIQDFPEVASVRDDETRHGDILTSLIKTD